MSLGDRILSYTLTPQQIFSLAHSICDAAAPPSPPCAPETSLEERAQQVTDWLIDSDYEDDHLCIAIGGAHAADDRKDGCEVSIGLRHPPVSDETDARTVFLSYARFAQDQDPTTDDVPLDIRIWEPGPWVDYLVTLARRAVVMLQNRYGDRGGAHRGTAGS